MRIQIDPHTLERARERGVERHEIEDTIKSGLSIAGKHGRLGKSKVYEFRQTRHGKFFEQKRVEVFYVIEETAIITVTTYAFYGKWEATNADTL
jgi:hypothetical protein